MALDASFCASLSNYDQMLFMVLLSYFLVTGGIIYDVIVEPPSMGSTTDERGHSRPVAFMQYRINGQGGNLKQSDNTFVKQNILNLQPYDENIFLEEYCFRQSRLLTSIV